MLESIRKRRNSIVILLAFAAIIIVFIFWGVGPTKNGNADQDIVATVDGDPITVRDYVNLYKREVEYYKRNLKDQFNEEMSKKLDLRHKALDILVNRELALKKAKAEGITVSEKDVQDAIKSIPIFSKNGAFDKDLYFSVLNSNKIKPADFEKSIETDLMTGKMRDKVVKEVSVKDDEVKQAYIKSTRKLNLDYLTVDPARFAGPVTVSDEDAANYFKKNGSEFMAPPRVKAFYAYVSLADLARDFKPDAKELKEYYDKNQKRFERPEQVRARHILIMFNRAAADQAKAKEAAKQKAEEVLRRVKNGENFTEMAKAYSQDPGSAKTGGDLGLFPKGVMVKSFEDAAFSLKKGETSGLVETEYGYHIIRVDDKKEGGTVPFKEAEDTVRKELTIRKANDAAKDIISGLEKSFKEAKDADSLKKAASAKGAKPQLTGLFSENDRNVELSGNDTLRSTVFSMKAGDVARAEDSGRFYAIKLLERVDAHVPDYADVSSNVKKKLLAERAAEAAKKKAEELLKRVKAGEDISNVAKSEKLKVEKTGFFSRAQGFIPVIGIFAAGDEKLFDLDVKSPYYPDLITDNGKYYVVKLNSVKEADESGFDAVKNEFKSRILAKKQEEAVGKWLSDLRARAKIQVFENRM